MILQTVLSFISITFFKILFFPLPLQFFSFSSHFTELCSFQKCWLLQYGDVLFTCLQLTVLLFCSQCLSPIMITMAFYDFFYETSHWKISPPQTCDARPSRKLASPPLHVHLWIQRTSNCPCLSLVGGIPWTMRNNVCLIRPISASIVLASDY